MIEASLIAMLLLPPRPGATAAFLASFFIAFLAYAVAARAVLRGAPAETGRGVTTIVLFACLFRATLLFAAPALSEDIYRYRWDGRVLLSGGNPYLTTPAEAERAGRPVDPLDARVAHREVGTIYPPAAQLFFALGALLTPGILGLKSLLVLCDLLGIACLRGILERRGLPSRRILLYAWNPLAVIEVAWSGHLEPLGVLLVLVAAAAIIQRRDLRSTIALVAAGLVKLLPLALFAPFLRSIRARVIVLVPLLFAAAFWPFRAAGRRVLGGAEEYARRWVANESIFGIVQSAIAWIGPTPALKAAIAWLRARVPGSEPLDHLYPYLYPPDLARAVCVAAALLVALVIVRRGIEPLRGAFVMTGALLLLSPTLHPWYVLWILPWICLFPSRAFILLSGLVALAYLNLGASGREVEPYPWVRLAEYLPFYTTLAAELFARRRR